VGWVSAFVIFVVEGGFEYRRDDVSPRLSLRTPRFRVSLQFGFFCQSTSTEVGTPFSAPPASGFRNSAFRFDSEFPAFLTARGGFAMLLDDDHRQSE
jgi:hypothetical protein